VEVWFVGKRFDEVRQQKRVQFRRKVGQVGEEFLELFCHSAAMALQCEPECVRLRGESVVCLVPVLAEGHGLQPQNGLRPEIGAYEGLQGVAVDETLDFSGIDPALYSDDIQIRSAPGPQVV